MTALNKSMTGAPLAEERALTWDSIPWNKAASEVKRLQVRIAKAISEKRFGKARALQRLLTHSFYGKSMAVKRVVQNRGSKSPGVDGIIWRTKSQKMQAVLSIKRSGYKAKPLRRIYIPKKNGRRPLSIPTMDDRAMQALHLLSLEPVAETLADKSSFGFRQKRSTADAIVRCFQCLNNKNSAQWILEGDIKSFFDRISFDWLENNIIMDKPILKKFLRAGYMEKNNIEATTQGLPQGGLASPALALIALSGLEDRLAKEITYSYRRKINLIFYADDFVITGVSKEVLENEVMPIVESFLAERGLELSREKSRITHISQGFDFLGFNVRKYSRGRKQQLLTKPAKTSIKSFLDKTRATIKTSHGLTAEELIRTLNPKIVGWCNYYRHSVASKVFSYVDGQIFKALWRSLRKKHSNKGANWIYQKYFQNHRSSRKWQFHAKIKDSKQNTAYIDLKKAGDTKIKRHIKIREEANPYDPNYFDYFKRREEYKGASPQTERSWVYQGLINA